MQPELVEIPLNLTAAILTSPDAPLVIVSNYLTTPIHRPLYRNTVISTLAVDGWAVAFGTVRSGLGGLRPRPVPSSLNQM